jgi:predicted MFS family arabinose efflux permease
MMAGAAGLLLLLLLRVEQQASNPIIPLSLFRHRGVPAVLVTSIFGFAAAAAPFLILTLYLRNVGGYAPEKIGLLFLPKALAVVAAGQITPWIMKRLAPRFGLALGDAMMAIGFLVIVLWGTPISAVIVLLGLMAFGAGSVVAMVIALNEVPRRAEADDRGVASAVVMAALSIATAFGIAVLAMVLQPATAGSPLNYDAAFYTAAGAAGIAALIALCAAG